MRTLLGAAFAVAVLCGPAMALDEVELFHGNGPGSCSGSYVKNIFSTGGLTVAVEQKQYVFGFMLPGLADQLIKGSYQGTVTFDAGEPFKINLDGDGGTYAGFLSGPQWYALRNVKTVTLTVRDKTFVFPADRMTDVMDGVAKCAGSPTVLEIRQSKERIVKALASMGWIVTNKDPQSACHGTRLGLEVDSFITERANGRFEFGVADRSWNLNVTTDEEVSLVIDQDAPRQMKLVKSHQTANVIADAELLQRLETARVAVWHLPWGTYRSEIDGFPAGRKKLADCLAK